MSTADLLAALKLSAPAPVADSEAVDVIDHKPAEPASPTALVLDKWSKRHGREWLAGSEQAREIFGDNPDDHAAADFLAAAFEPEPRLAPRCEDEGRGQFISELLATPQYHALHCSTALDEAASELAACSFAKSYCEHRAEQEKRDSKPGSEPSMPADLAAAVAAGKAISEASAEVSDLKDAQRALGSMSMGGDGGGTNSPLSGKALLERFHRVKHNASLRKIMQLAGRYRRAAQALQRQKTLHGRDDVVGVELDNDLGRILPSELATLDDPDLELDTLRRFVERSLMCRQYRGVEKKAKGPVVITVDESGSMSGEKVENAKALALAMVWVAHHENRYACLIGYSGGDAPNVLVLPPRKPLPDQLMDWLEHFYGAGSNRDVPIKELPEIWDSLGCPKGKTDVISLTDAVCHIPPAMAADFRAWKDAEHVKYYVMVIGGYDEKSLQDVADVTTNIDELTPDTEAVKEVMSI